VTDKPLHGSLENRMLGVTQRELTPGELTDVERCEAWLRGRMQSALEATLARCAQDKKKPA